jgi:hypothetical protein
MGAHHTLSVESRIPDGGPNGLIWGYAFLFGLAIFPGVYGITKSPLCAGTMTSLYMFNLFYSIKIAPRPLDDYANTTSISAQDKKILDK